MFRTLIASIAVALMVGIGGIESAFAGGADDGDDVKSVPGSQCKAKKGSQQSDFVYSGGSIKNKTNSNRKIVCPILRDRHDSDILNDLISVQIFVNVHANAVDDGKTFDCTAEVRDYTSGVLMDSETGTISVQGNGNMLLRDLDYSGGSNDAVQVVCTVPAKSRLRAIHYIELLSTDVGE